MHSMQPEKCQTNFPEIIIVMTISGGGILLTAEVEVKQEMPADLIQGEVSDVS